MRTMPCLLGVFFYDKGGLVELFGLENVRKFS